ncbi:uncharacterized protein [Malus domestica]|uniref:uncharacterized protein n=1 Tax=Malus domestica TaxID=3750 RepID=UPI0039756F69
MYFDGSSTSTSVGVGIVLQSPHQHRWFFSLKLDFDCTNNQAEYEALVIGLSILHDLHAARVLVFGDSKLVINQLNGNFRCMSCTLAPYHMVASYLAESFNSITFNHISCGRNTVADELAQITSGAQLLGSKSEPMISVLRQSYSALVNQQVLQRDQVIRTRVMSLPSLLEQKDPVDVCAVETLPNDWRRPIMQYLDNPRGQHDRKTKVHATNYVLYQNELYRKGEDGLLLLCLGPQETAQAITEAYQTSPRLATGTTPYALTYGHDAMLPVELSVNSLRVIEHSSLSNAEYNQVMLQELEDLEEDQLNAYNLLMAQKKITERAYNQRVKQKMFGEGELIWQTVLPMGIKDLKFGKWSPNWEGLFVVHKVLGKGAYHLRDRTDVIHRLPINGKFLKKYYPVTWEMQE